MTVTPRERARARTFALALDGAPVEDVTLLAMARLSDSLAGLGAAAPTDAFRIALRNRIIAVGAVSITPMGGLAAPAPWRRRLVAASAVLAISGAGISATAVAAGDALPGDRLYDIKRAVESMQLALAGSEVAKAERYLTMAATRLDEVAALLAENPNASADPVLVEHLRTTMASMRDAIGEAGALFFAVFERTGDAGVLAPLQAFIIDHAAGVTEVGQQLPIELARSQGALIDEMAGIGYKVASVTERSAATALDRVGAERASRNAARSVLAYTATSVQEAVQSADKAVQAADKAVQAANEAAAASADQAAAAPDAEADAAHSEAVQQEVQRLVELQVGGAGTVEDTDVDVKPRESKAGSAQASTDAVDGTQATNVGSASQRLLSVLPVPGAGVDSAVPGSLSAGLDLTGGLGRLAQVSSQN